MSSGDFNLLHLRNLKMYNPDGSYVSTGYVFTVSTQGVPLYTNSLSLSGVTASSITTSTLNASGQIGFSTLVGSSLVAGSAAVSTATISTLTLTNQVTISSVVASSLVTGSQSASSITVSTLNSSAQMGFSSLVGSSLVTGSGAISTLTVSTLNLSNQVTVSSLNASSISTGLLTTQDIQLMSTTLSLGLSTNSTVINFSQGDLSAASWLTAKTGMVNVRKLGTSASGQYQLVVAGATSDLWLSSDAGITWSALSPATTGLPTLTGSAYWSSGSISANGQYILLGVYGGSLWFSQDFGRTFALTSQPTPNIWLQLNGNVNDAMGGPAATATGSPGYVTIQHPGYSDQAINLANTAGGTATRYVRGNWTGASNFTVSLWVNVQTLSASQIFFSSYASTCTIYMDNTNKLSCYIPTGGGANGALLGATSYNATVNTWYYLTLIFQTNGLCSFYVNNVLIGSLTNSQGVGGLTTSQFSLGTYDNATTIAFNGYLADLRILNSAPAYVPLPHLQPNIWLPMENNTNNLGSQADADPLINLPFEGNTNDAKGFSTITPTGSFTYVGPARPGITGSQAIVLANTAGGTATNYIRGTWTGAANMTVSFWINPQTLNGTYQNIFQSYSESFGVLINNNNQLYAVIPSGGGTTRVTLGDVGTTLLTTNTWFHVLLIFQTSGTCSLYFNGRLVESKTNSQGVGTLTTSVFGLGTSNINTLLAFNGYIDDLRIYNSAVYYNPAGFVTGSVSYVPGVVGLNAVNLVNTAGGTATNYLTTPWPTMANCTISFWFNMQSVGGSFMELYSADTNGNFEAFITTATMALTVQVPSNSGQMNAGVTGALSLNTWYHVYVIFQTGGTCSLYLNGALVGSATNVNGTAGTSWSALTIGRETWSNVSAFNGYIDDFRLYNAAIPIHLLLPQNYRSVALSGTGQYALASAASGWVVGSSTTGQTWTKQAVCVGTQSDLIQPNLTGLGANAWSQNGVNWAVSASSTFSGSFPVYNAFNNLGSSRWASVSAYNSSGVYTGSNSTTITGIGAISGEWLQIQAFTPLVLSSYTFTAGYTVAQMPKGFYLAGSTDGSTWFPLHQCQLSTNPFTLDNTFTIGKNNITVNQTGIQTLLGDTTGSGTTTSYTTSTTPYLYFRIVINTVWSGAGTPATEIGELYLNFSRQTPASHPSALSLSYSGQYQLVATGSAAGNVMPNQTGLATATWSQGGVQWGATASTNALGAEWRAFNNVNAVSPWGSANIYNTTTGAYPGTVSTTIQAGIGAQLGEWLQIQASVPLVLQSYTFGCWGTTTIPKTYYIVGSMDGSTWYPLQLVVMSVNPFTTTYSTATTYITTNTTGSFTISAGTTGSGTSTSYSYTTQPWIYFRIIAMTIWGSNFGSVEISELYLNFQNSASYSSNYGSSWLNSSRTLSNEIVSLSPSGQYALSTNCVPPLARLTFDNTAVDAQGVLVPATGAGTVTYSSSIVRVGAYSAFFNNTAGTTPSVYLNYTVPAVLNTPPMLTISCWVYPTSLSGTNGILTLNANTTAGTIIYLTTTGLVQCDWTTTTASGGTGSFAYTGSAPLNTWSHIVMTYISGSMTFYLNGVSIGTDTRPTGNLCAVGGVNITNIFIGTRTTTALAFAGYIDDVRLYTQALSADEVNALYRNPALTQSIGVSSSYLPITSYTEPILPGATANVVDAKVSQTGQYMVAVTSEADTPLARLTLDNTAADAQSALTAVTGAGTVTYSTTIKKVGTHSALFSNTAGSATVANYLNYSVPTSLNNPTAMTLSLWIYPTALPVSNSSVPLAFNNSTNTTNASQQFLIDSAGVVTFNLVTSVSSTTLTLNTVSINTWYHYVMTFSSGVCALYVNGAYYTGSSPGGNLALTTANAAQQRLIVGGALSNSNAYAGYIDDIRIYPSVLTPAQVSSLYTTNAAINNVYYSTDFGATFSALSLGTAPMTACSLSNDGSYLTVSNATTVYTLNRNSTGFTLALGNQAGQQNQASNSIAIGNLAGQLNQSANSIVLNASGSALNATAPGFYVSPIADTAGLPMNLLGYGADSQVVKSGITVWPGGNFVGIGTTTNPIYGNNPLINNTVTIFGLAPSLPSSSGSSNMNGTLFINSINPWGYNVGASIALGGKGYNFGGGEQHMTFARISGVQNPNTGAYYGDFTVETQINGSMYERMRVAAGGNVGIGTTNPPYNLSVFGTSSIFSLYLAAPNTNNTQLQDFGILNVCSGTASSSYTVLTASLKNAAYNSLALNPFGGNVGIGLTNPSSTLQVNGSLAKSSGTFDIAHPLYPDTAKRLVHSFIEGPRCDLIYRGKTMLFNGVAYVNIDRECTQNAEGAMDYGTFNALCANPQFFLQNTNGFDRVKGSVLNGVLTITCENPNSSDMISWMVVAERKDAYIKQWDRTDVDGFLVTQYETASASAPEPAPAPASAPAPAPAPEPAPAPST